MFPKVKCVINLINLVIVSQFKYIINLIFTNVFQVNGAWFNCFDFLYKNIKNIHFTKQFQFANKLTRKKIWFSVNADHMFTYKYMHL